MSVMREGIFNRSEILALVGEWLAARGEALAAHEGLSLLSLIQLEDKDFDARVDEAPVYGLIFTRALLGNECINFDQSIDGACSSFDLRQIGMRPSSFETSELTGADLVARVTLDLLRAILRCRSLLANVSDCVISLNSASDAAVLTRLETLRLNFLSADFVRIQRKKDSLVPPENGFSDGAFEHFGWQHFEERDLISVGVPNNEIYCRDTKGGKIESFLAHDHFYADPEAAFCAIFDGRKWHSSFDELFGNEPLDSVQGQERWGRFFTHSIKPLLDFKSNDFDGNDSGKGNRLFRIVFCAGIAEQGGASFRADHFENGLGLFYTIDIHGEKRQIEPREAEKIAPSLIAAIIKKRNLTRFRMAQAFNAMLGEELKVAIEKLEEKNAELEKSAAMLQLLRSPVQKISDALIVLQAEAQELRSILNDPMDALSAAQPQIAALFDEQVPLTAGFGGPEHNLSRYRQEDRFDQGQRVLAVALALFRGQSYSDPISVGGKPASGSDALRREVQIWASEVAKDPARKGLSDCVLRLLEKPSWEAVSASVDRKAEVIAYLGEIKARFFTAYKPSRATFPLLLALVKKFVRPELAIRVCTPTSEQTQAFASEIVLVRHANPCATQGHFAEFVASLLNQVAIRSTRPIAVEISPSGYETEDGIILLDSAKEACIRFTSDAAFILPAGQKLLKELLVEELNNRISQVVSLGEYGDFHRIFVKLVRRLPQSILSEVSVDASDGIVTIYLGPSVSIQMGDELIIRSQQPGPSK